MFNSNICDGAEMLGQMKLLYCISNCLVMRHLIKCSKCRKFCTTFHSCYFVPQHKNATFSKFRVVLVYNYVYRKILSLCRRSSASKKFAANNTCKIKVLMKKSFFAFVSRLLVSNNAIICTIQKSWI